MSENALAVLGGVPVREGEWPKWPRGGMGTLDVLKDVVDSSRWTLSGPYDGRTSYERRFAHAFADFNEISLCTPTTSGTAALTLLALLALGVRPGSEVVVPGLTWVACASSVVNIGAVPVLADVDPETLAMSVEDARSACSNQTAAIMVVHPFCTVADIDAFLELSEELGVPVIEDCAQAHGARWRGRRVGTFGVVGCFSMQQSKLLTCGEGGAVLTDDHDLYEKVEQLRCDGRVFAETPEIGRLELVEVGAVQGRNLCMSEFHAAVLYDRLQYLDQENERRREQAEYLEECLEGVDGVSVLRADSRVTNRTFYSFVMRFDRDRFGQSSIHAIGRALSAELGTQVHPVYLPLNRHPLLCPHKLQRGAGTAQSVLDMSRFPLVEAEQAHQSCLTLGQSVWYSPERMDTSSGDCG